MAIDPVDKAQEPLEFFYHYVNAHDHMKLKKLIRSHGMEGVGRWWTLCELLGAQKTHRIDTHDADERGILMDDLRYSEWDECEAFLSRLASIRLIDAESFDEGRSVFSNRMFEHCVTTAKKKVAGSKGGKATQSKAG